MVERWDAAAKQVLKKTNKDWRLPEQLAQTRAEVAVTARCNPQSLSDRDWPREIVALVTSNYLNGYRDVATQVLVRYGEERKREAFVGLTHTDPKLMMISWRVLIKHVVRRFFGALKRRIARVFHR
jgi:hypothetical protein